MSATVNIAELPPDVQAAAEATSSDMQILLDIIYDSRIAEQSTLVEETFTKNGGKDLENACHHLVLNRLARHDWLGVLRPTFKALTPEKKSVIIADYGTGDYTKQNLARKHDLSYSIVCKILRDEKAAATPSTPAESTVRPKTFTQIDADVILKIKNQLGSGFRSQVGLCKQYNVTPSAVQRIASNLKADELFVRGTIRILKSHAKTHIAYFKQGQETYEYVSKWIDEIEQKYHSDNQGYPGFCNCTYENLMRAIANIKKQVIKSIQQTDYITPKNNEACTALTVVPTSCNIAQSPSEASPVVHREALAQRIVDNIGTLSVKLRELEDDIRQLWIEFENLKEGETILGCTTKTEFCVKYLHRTPQAVRYMLNPDLRRKQCLPTAVPESRGNPSASSTRRQSHEYMAELGRYYNALKRAVIVRSEEGFNIVDSSTDERIPDMNCVIPSQLSGDLGGACHPYECDVYSCLHIVFDSEAEATRVLNGVQETVYRWVDKYTDQDLATATLRCCETDFFSLQEMQKHRQESHGQLANGGNFRKLQAQTSEPTRTLQTQTLPVEMEIADALDEFVRNIIQRYSLASSIEAYEIVAEICRAELAHRLGL